MTSITDSSQPEQKPQPKTQGRKWLYVIVGLLTGLFFGWIVLSIVVGRPYFGRVQYHGTVLQSPQPAPNFTLTAVSDQEVSLRDFQNKVVLLYFGYTYCPDVCPATMVELKQAIEALPARDADRVQVIMVSVDPLRDTPEQLASYVTHFHDSFIGVTGSEQELLGIVTQYGVYYEKHEGTPASGYLIDHTATVTLVDKDGRIRIVYPFDTSGEDIAADLRYLVRE